MPAPQRFLRISRDGGTFTQEPSRFRDDDLAARRSVEFLCPRGHEFAIPFADNVAPPTIWKCRQHGIDAGLTGTATQPQRQVETHNHWDKVRERRPETELVRLLNQQLNELRAGRLVPVGQWLRQRQAMRNGREVS
jgi:RNA polymerase binding protein RbpA